MDSNRIHIGMRRLTRTGANFRPENMVPWAVRKNCLLGWLTAKYLVVDDGVRQRAKDAITKLGYLPQADMMAKRVKAVLHSKPKMISRVTEALQIPRQEAYLVVFDPRTRTKSVSEIPLQ
jgi:hypothetical protein